MIRLLVGISGSFCNHQAVLEECRKLSETMEIQFVLTKNTAASSTRFFQLEDFLKACEEISAKKIIQSIVEAELIGPQNQYDIMLIAPATANIMSRLANGAYDCPVALAAKAMIRNQKNVVIALASNDVLGLSSKNVFQLYNTKNFYFVPFEQDDHIQKPNSCVACFDMIEKTLQLALQNIQIQPVIKEKKYE